MIRVSRRQDYAIILVNELARNFKKRLVPLSQVAKQYGLSLLFLRNIAFQLKNAGIVKAVEGKNGGYILSRDPSKIRIGEIIETMTTRPLFSCCQNTLDGKCRIHACPHGFSLRRLNNEFIEKIYNLNLSQLHEEK